MVVPEGGLFLVSEVPLYVACTQGLFAFEATGEARGACHF